MYKVEGKDDHAQGKTHAQDHLQETYLVGVPLGQLHWVEGLEIVVRQHAGV